MPYCPVGRPRSGVTGPGQGPRDILASRDRRNLQVADTLGAGARSVVFPSIAAGHIRVPGGSGRQDRRRHHQINSPRSSVCGLWSSANWHASAALIARYCREALLIDMGSTTTDIIPIVAGAVAARGYTDAERLATRELAYGGLVRSLAFLSANRAAVSFSCTVTMAGWPTRSGACP